jgi:hypothetical protein
VEFRTEAVPGVHIAGCRRMSGIIVTKERSLAMEVRKELKPGTANVSEVPSHRVIETRSLPW